MNKLTLAVIIPNYNNERYLKKCVFSVLEQSLSPDEIIIVDDCSTDHSRELIKELETYSSNIRGIFLEANSGVSVARNTGLENAVSEYVTFIDSDDFYYSKDKLKNEMSLINTFLNKKMDIAAYSAIIMINEDGTLFNVQDRTKGWFMRGNIFYDLVARIRVEVTPRDYCIRKNVLKQAGAYCYPKNFYEDLDLLIRLSRIVPFYCTYEYGTAYRNTSGGLSRRPIADHRKEVAGILESYKKDLNKIDTWKVMIRKVAWNIEEPFLRAQRKLKKIMKSKKLWA